MVRRGRALLAITFGSVLSLVVSGYQFGRGHRICGFAERPIGNDRGVQQYRRPGICGEGRTAESACIKSAADEAKRADDSKHYEGK